MKRKVLALKLRGHHTTAQKSTSILKHIKLRVYCKLDSCLSQVLFCLALSSSHTPAPASLCLCCPSTPLPLPHIQQAHPQDHPLPPLSAVQSLLTELSPDGKRGKETTVGSPQSAGRETLLRQLLG